MQQFIVVISHFNNSYIPFTIDNQHLIVCIYEPNGDRVFRIEMVTTP